jgi:hypothetical protein
MQDTSVFGTISDQTKDETDKAWVLLRMLSRRTIELPVFTNKVQQVVPFWTGFYKPSVMERDRS